MDWLTTGLVIVFTALLVQVGNLVYRFIEGRAKFQQSDLVIVVGGLQEELIRITKRLDKRIEESNEFRERLLDCEKKHAASAMEVDMLKEEVKRLQEHRP